MRAFLIVLLTVSFFRLFHLSDTPAGLYWDELDTGYQSYSLLLTGRDYFGNVLPAHLQSFADFRSPLYMYLSVPIVKLAGLSVASVRLTGIICSLLILPVLFYLSRKLLRLPFKHGWIAPAVWGLAPWTLVQGRIAAESMLMPLFLLLGLAFFIKSTATKTFRPLLFSGLFFGLTMWTYGTAKLFLPLFLVLVAIYYLLDRKNHLPAKYFIYPAIVFFLVVFLPAKEVFFKNVSMRFNELSVFSDPTTVSEVNFRRLESSLGHGSKRELGMQPSVAEKMVNNKLTIWAERILGNYYTSLSTDFLFTSGDPQLRHNINLTNVGQFYPVEMVAFLVGLLALLRFPNNRKSLQLLLILWLVIAPIPSIITRDGGNHGPRLLPLLPPMVLIISLGVSNLLKNRIAGKVYLGIYAVSVFLAGFYLFGTYRVKSAFSFNTKFVEAVNFGLSEDEKYDRVIFDGQNESFLMAYLFATKLDPAVFQSSFPLPSAELDTGVGGYKFGNFYILYPGTRDWNKIKLTGKNLIICSTTQSNWNQLTLDRIFLNPDGSPALAAVVK